VGSPQHARADEPGWRSRGEIALEARAFDDDDEPLTRDRALGFLARLEAGHRGGGLGVQARAFARADAYDQGRSTFVVEELWGEAAGSRVRLRVGSDIVNWSATEAFHPADVLNARNLDSDLENFEKVGEPMVALQVRLFAGTSLHVYGMPVRTQPIFPSPNSRLNFGQAGVDLRGRHAIVDRDGDLSDSTFGPQAAVMLRQVIGPADLTVHALEHVDRSQPQAAIDYTGLAPDLRLVFQTMLQVGGTAQVVLGPVIVKVEGAWRRFVRPSDAVIQQFSFVEPGDPNAGPLIPWLGRDHGAVALGLEYGMVHDGGAESTFIAEGQAYLGVADRAVRRTLNPFQRDVLAGYRFALGDAGGTEAFAGAIFDLEEPGEFMVNVSFQRRIGETWTVKAGLRIFRSPAGVTDGIAAFDDADHVRLTLTRHF